MDTNDTITLAQLFDSYMQYASSRLKTCTRIEGIYRRYLNHIAQTNALDFSTSDVEALRDILAETISPKTANSATELLSTMYNRGHESGIIPDCNPVRGLQKFSIDARERKLESDEMGVFFKALSELKNEIVRDYFLMCILTSELKSRVLEMCWDDIDLQRGVWFIRQRTGRGSNPIVFLLPEALEILRRHKASAVNRWVFPSMCALEACSHPCAHVSKSGHIEDPDKAWASLIKRSEISNLRLNDLRNSSHDMHLVREAMAEHFRILPPQAVNAKPFAPSLYLQKEATQQRKEAAIEALANPVERAELPLQLLELSPWDRTSTVMTLGSAFEYYMQHHGARRKTASQMRANFNRYLRGIANRPVDQIKSSDLLELRDYMGENIGHAAANRALEIVSAVYNKCRRWGVIDVQNPADAVSLFSIEARDRFLSTEEINRFLEAVEKCTSRTFRAWILLCLYTGAREANVRAMRWCDIDMQARTWRIPYTKSGRPHVIPLIQEAIGVIESQRGLNSEWVLPGQDGHIARNNRAWSALLKSANLSEDTRLHDLRRTMGSWQAKTGSTLHVIGKTLGHTNTGATAIYAQLDVEPIRESMEKAVRGMRGVPMDAQPLNLAPGQLAALAETLAGAVASRLRAQEEVRSGA